MPRTAGSRNKATMEYIARYEEKAAAERARLEEAGEDGPADPFDVLWALALDGKVESQHRIQAARSLLPYRYPTLKSVEVTADGQLARDAESGQLSLVWDADADDAEAA